MNNIKTKNDGSFFDYYLYRKIVFIFIKWLIINNRILLKKSKVIYLFENNVKSSNFK